MSHPHGTAVDILTHGPQYWSGSMDGCLRMLDQTLLPSQEVWLNCTTLEHVQEAICSLRVRGAPAIGIAAAYGLCLSMQRVANAPLSQAMEHLAATGAWLRQSRPTAVNLGWAIDRMALTAARHVESTQPAQSQAQSHLDLDSLTSQLRVRLLEEALAIHAEDRAMCQAIGRFGCTLLPPQVQSVLTHCNAGALATGGMGTALAVIYAAHASGRPLHVYADETRPLLQGARLTAWELSKAGIPVTVLCDSMAASLMKSKKVGAVITGADRIAANGDTANKIGTYGVALAAKAHGIPFFVAAPSSSFDLNLPTGDGIPIEFRKDQEVSCPFGHRTVPEKVLVHNPAFDVTPADLITAIICERGIIQPVTPQTVAAMLGSARP